MSTEWKIYTPLNLLVRFSSQFSAIEAVFWSTILFYTSSKHRLNSQESIKNHSDDRKERSN